MKKIIAFVATLAVSMAAFSAYAQQAPEQENVLFKHVSVGVGVGILDGLQVQAATTILPNLQARILYTDFFPYIGIANGILKNKAGIGINPFEYNITGINYHENSPKVNIDEVNLQGKAHQRNISLLADFFPFKKSSFHITGGIMVSLSRSLLSGKGTMKNTKNDEPVMSKENFGSLEFFGVTTDYDGNLLIDVQYKANVVKPYLGIGFGRPCSTQHRVGVNFDMGVAYTGGIHAYSYNYSEGAPQKVELNEAWVNAPGNEDLKDNIGDAGQYLQYITKVNNFPIMPYLRFTVNVAIF